MMKQMVSVPESAPPPFRALLRDSESPALRAAYRALRFPYAKLREWRTRARMRPYLALQRRQRDEAAMLAVQYLLRHLDGDIAEFGVGRGNHYSPTIRRQLAAWGHVRSRHPSHHLFDSFAGWGNPTEEDAASWEIAAGLWSSTDTKGQTDAATLRQKLRRLHPSGPVVVHAGFFADTLQHLDPALHFGMIVLDADLYSSTRTALHHLFSQGQVEDGAILLFNGWNQSAASPKTGARRAWSEAVKEFEVDHSPAGFYGMSGAKFIVHGYRNRPPGGRAI
jgi:hypothetical protein